MVDVNLFLSPHQDDETLFGCYTLLREHPKVIVCLRSEKQEQFGITGLRREAETRAVMRILGCQWEQWDEPDVDPDWDEILWLMNNLGHDWDVVYAPYPEPEGHEQHNIIGNMAATVYRNVVFYTTYNHVTGERTTGNLVHYEPEWVTLKLRALACYTSQIETPAAGCFVHFTRGLDEYTL